MSVFPSVPNFPDDIVEACRKLGRTTPAVFEWTKYVAVLAAVGASILDIYPSFRDRPAANKAVLRASLARCAMLLRGMLELGSKDRFGHSISVLSRSVVETAITAAWLCKKADDEYFFRFLADGLKTDLELASMINKNIDARGGKSTPVERRMLRSVESCCRAYGLTPSQVQEAKKLPPVATMFEDLHGTRDYYILVYKLGSHSVHGTATDLITNHLSGECPDALELQYNDPPPDDDQLRAVSLFVAESIRWFLSYMSLDGALAPGNREVLDRTVTGIAATQYWLRPEDFEAG